MPTSPSTRAALYARVSTHHGQDVGLQLDALREVAAARDWVVVPEFVDEGIEAPKHQTKGVPNRPRSRIAHQAKQSTRPRVFQIARAGRLAGAPCRAP